MNKFAVIGLGKFGFHVARTLYEHGNNVIAIDLDKARVNAIDAYCTEAVVLDATDEDAIRTLGLENMDGVIVSTGNEIGISMLICLYLKEMGAKQILAKATNENHGKILKMIGATQIAHPEKEMAIRMARGLSTPNILDFLPLAEGYELVQVVPPQGFFGKNLKELNLRAKYGVHIIAIKESMPENFVLVPPASFIIKDSDILIMLGKSEDIQKVKALRVYNKKP